ncbi:hypothetical protein [Maritalea sp.]|uniref:hypothetical protein n=1 Tax=Maritalea sp. TaxID=2003361 RepID=UPI003EF34E40
MTNHVFELVTFKVKDPEQTKLARRDALAAAKKLPGFVKATALINHEDPTQFADLVEWESIEDAKSAAEMVMKIPEFAPMMEQIETVEGMNHFNIEHVVE